MGYRSQVAIAIEFKALTKEIITLFKDADTIYVQEDDFQCVVFYYDSIKWYDNLYPEIMDKMAPLYKMDEESPESFGYMRIGEEIGDIDLLGRPSLFGIYTIQEIQIDDAYPDISADELLKKFQN